MRSFSRVPKLAATGLSLSLLAIPASASAVDQPPASLASANAVNELAHNPVRVKQLATSALSDFESGIKTSAASVWIIVGGCAVMGSRQPNSSGKRSVEVIPNPGIVHILDSKTGATVDEVVGWDSSTKSYITGTISILPPAPYKGSTHTTEGANQEHNIFLSGAKIVPLFVDSQMGKIFTDSSPEISVMNVVHSELTSSSLADYASSTALKHLCDTETANPPSFNIQINT